MNVPVLMMPDDTLSCPQQQQRCPENLAHSKKRSIGRHIIWSTDVTDACLSLIDFGGHRITGYSMGAEKIHDVERRMVQRRKDYDIEERSESNIR